jgi:hypothetical protein
MKPDALSCGTSAPLLPTCVAHGLAKIDLTGTWMFTGTEVTTPVMPPGPTTTSIAQHPIPFNVVGCMLAAEAPSHVDDTNATASQLVEGGLGGLNGRAIGPATICANGDGTLSFHWTKDYFEAMGSGGVQINYDDTGTLTKIGP